MTAGGLGHGGAALGDGPGDAEVHHLHLARGGDHDVAGLDVAVHDAGAVGDLQRAADVGGDLQRPLGQQPALLEQQVAQRPPLDVLHDDERGAVGVLAGVVDRTMDDALSDAAACASRRNRPWNDGSRARSWRSSLMATSRPSRTSVPRWTSAMPPRPTRSPTS
jgi:hypothetical protein